MASLFSIVSYLDKYLRIGEIEDWPDALNGLQIENSGTVKKIGAAVDASTPVLAQAAARKIDFLLVHHGLFWSGKRQVTGILRRQLKLAFENDIALYAAHLPLDLHHEIGNNALLAKSLGLKSTEPFLEEKGQLVALKARASISCRELVRKLENSLGEPVRAFHFGPKRSQTIGIITGAGGSEIQAVAHEHVDTFITGEAPHWAAVAAEELGVNLILGGHYATETFAVKTLARHLATKFRVPFEFIDHPTGL